VHRLLTFLMLLAGGQIAATEPIWIDVRSPAEFAAGHLPAAHNIPMGEVAVRVKEFTTDPNADLRVYCGIGVRAQIAKLQLESAGYRNVTNEGGFADIVARQRAAAATQTAECQPTSPLQEKKEGPC
jgi:phage shock protein E